MKRKLLILGIFFFAFPVLAYAQNTPLPEPIQNLIKKSKDFDNKNVCIRGEVTGDVMFRKNFAWLSIRDNTGTIGAWVHSDLAQKITTTGDYGHTGDTIEVVGVFLKQDLELNGELCIRASGLEVLQPGYPSPHKISALKIEFALILFVITMCVVVLRLIVNRKVELTNE